MDEDPRVREVLKSGEGICLTLSTIVNRPLDLSLNSLNVRLCVLGSGIRRSIKSLLSSCSIKYSLIKGHTTFNLIGLRLFIPFVNYLTCGNGPIESTDWWVPVSDI